MQPALSDIPTMRYYAIGNGGHRLSVGANGITKPEPIQHRSTDAALYNHIPFVMRELLNDLPIAERNKYGLRRIETWGGRQYATYYLKRMTLANVVAAMEYIAVLNGVSTVTEFVPDSSNLNPVPPDLSASGVNVVTGDYVAATAKIGLVLSTADINELLSVATIIYGDDSYAIISEIALCSGVDKVVSSPSIGSTVINFNEVIAAQVMSHINTFFPLKFSNNGTEILLDVGSTEPTLALI